MKNTFNNKYYIILVALTLAISAVCAATAVACAEDIALAKGNLYGLLTDEKVELYEREIAGGEPILSGKSQAYIARAASALNITVEKYRALVLLQDLQSRVQDATPLSDLARLSDVRLMMIAKDAAEKYMALQSDERQRELRNMLVEILSVMGNQA